MTESTNRKFPRISSRRAPMSPACVRKRSARFSSSESTRRLAVLIPDISTLFRYISFSFFRRSKKVLPLPRGRYAEKKQTFFPTKAPARNIRVPSYSEKTHLLHQGRIQCNERGCHRRARPAAEYGKGKSTVRSTRGGALSCSVLLFHFFFIATILSTQKRPAHERVFFVFYGCFSMYRSCFLRA